MLGAWTPSPRVPARPARRRANCRGDRAQPYPFFLASPLEAEPDIARARRRLAAGMEMGRHPRAADPPRQRRRAVVARRGAARRALPGDRSTRAPRCRGDAVLDGELLGWREGDAPLPFTALQTRIQRRKPGAEDPRRQRRRACSPTTCSSCDGEDLRARPLARTARAARGRCSPRTAIRAWSLSPRVVARDWDDAARLRDARRANAASKA